ncbi:myelin basic protein isoform X3 [Cololabis saira]|uniref:myelin basic protein isoform X3 n=2 Tax=Cololabis saira TaxID=129043 RepID=UPI002AD3D8FC|nr:myelin basic protein isoform X3 [Cololabis saira]
MTPSKTAHRASDGDISSSQSDSTPQHLIQQISSSTAAMATASTSGQSAFGLGRKKKNPGLMDQISTFFGGDKKKRSKGSFRGHLAASPQQSSARRRTTENAVVQFFRSIASSSPTSTKSPLRRRRDQSTLSRLFNLGDSKSRPPPKRWSTIF